MGQCKKMIFDWYPIMMIFDVCVCIQIVVMSDRWNEQVKTITWHKQNEKYTGKMMMMIVDCWFLNEEFNEQWK